MSNLNIKLGQSQIEKKNVGKQLLEQIKAELNAIWFAAVAEKNSKRRASLLEKYRALKRSYETQNLLFLGA